MTEILQKKQVIGAPVEKVFSYMDDLTKTGMHMSERSTMMMGGKLELEQLTGPEKGIGASFRWKGKMMGFPLDFTVAVTKWIENKEKVWETIGTPRLIILGSYLMRLKTEPVKEGTHTSLEIQYERPKGFFYNFLYLLFAGWYARWCLNRMLGDAKIALEA